MSPAKTAAVRGQREPRRATCQEHSAGGRRDGGEDETDARPGSLLEVSGNERRMNACADCAAEDHDVHAQLGERHPTITVPCMSWLCSVQT